MSDVFSDMPSVDVTRYRSPQVVSNAARPMTVRDAMPAAQVNTQSADVVNLSTTQNQKKPGPIKRLKGFIANVKKFFATAGEYTKGFFKGIIQGATTGALIYTIGDIANGLITKKASKVTAEAGAEAAKKVVKKVPNKALAAIAVVGAIAINLWNSSLNATEKRSEIEHRWTGHNQ